MSKLIILALIFTSCLSSEKAIFLSGKTMGTTYSIKLFAKNIDKLQLQRKVDLFLKDYNQVFSTYIADSELSSLNKFPVNKVFNASKELVELIKFSKEVHLKSKGYFDITVGPIVNRWGFGPVKRQGQPSDDEIKSLAKNIGSNFLKLSDNKITKLKAVYVDLSAVAKGDGVDKLANFIESTTSSQNYFIEIGGEVIAKGKKLDGTPWRVGIEKPSLQKGSALQRVVKLKDEAIATSGSYRNFIKYGDSVFSHTIDPKSFYPVNHKMISVSVISSNCAKSDAWATAFMSMGLKKSLDLAKKEGLKAVFLIKENGEVKEYQTGSFN